MKKQSAKMMDHWMEKGMHSLIEKLILIINFKRYFSCESGYVGIVKPYAVEVLEEDGHLPVSEKQESIEEI